MRLARLELTNFRCLGEMGLDLHPKLTFLCAQNAAGKSSLLDAIEWCLTGRCRGTDDRGAGSKGLIREGEAAMTVKTICDDGTYVTRQLARSGTMRVDPPDPVVNKDMLRVLMNGAGFLDLSHVDAKNLLLAALDVRVPVNGVSLTLPEVESQYQMAFAERRDQKVRLVAIHVPALPQGEVPNVEALEKKLADLRAQEQAAVAQEAHTGGRRGQLVKNVARAQQDLVDVQRQILALECPDDIDAQIAALEAVAEAPGTDIDAALAHHHARWWRQTLSGIEQHQPSKGCVLHSDIPCKTPAKAFTDHLLAVQRLIVDAETVGLESASLIDQLIASEAEHEDRVASYDRLTRLRERRGELGLAHTKAVLALSVAQNEVAECPAESGPSPELLVLRERIQKGQGIIRDAREHLRLRLEHEDKTKARSEAAETLQRLEARVELLGPKGVRLGALGEALEAFSHSINEALDRFGYTLDFMLDPWGVSVNGRDSALLSTSERLRVGVAFALALATATGIGFVAIDGADALDGPGRAVLVELVMTWGGGQVVVASTRDEPLTSSEGMLAYWLAREHDGAVTGIVRT